MKAVERRRKRPFICTMQMVLTRRTPRECKACGPFANFREPMMLGRDERSMCLRILSFPLNGGKIA